MLFLDLHPCLRGCCGLFELDGFEDIFLIWIRAHLFLLPTESLLCFPFHSALISSIMFPRHTQLYLPFLCCCCCCHWLFTARQQIAFCWVLCHQTSTMCPRAFTNIHTRAHSFLMFLFLFAFGSVFIWVHISSFYVLLTAEWHQQVSWLGQFGWYKCYYQHPTFRRIPGSCTDLSNLMLKWNQALTHWPCDHWQQPGTRSCADCRMFEAQLLLLRVFAVQDVPETALHRNTTCH